ncbi:uncharacterized protein FOBCDRAFT_208853 [Fusarium oxysporum Fo47]|uniref:uncharacterized protein n=1 Tax=Fusarium oxysporum Fo47 TaxID=660027 RepID=UPI002869E570|nr:uncharacterized protein FOBCDRAFT_208853 [Fusarium oxysporum Fo47]QKD62187.2 hypothetical protein FOBCDRAFT_208853 [Fusarium oxysporum Fo47]
MQCGTILNSVLLCQVIFWLPLGKSDQAADVLEHESSYFSGLGRTTRSPSLSVAVWEHALLQVIQISTLDTSYHRLAERLGPESSGPNVSPDCIIVTGNSIGLLVGRDSCESSPKLFEVYTVLANQELLTYIGLFWIGTFDEGVDFEEGGIGELRVEAELFVLEGGKQAVPCFRDDDVTDQESMSALTAADKQ